MLFRSIASLRNMTKNICRAMSLTCSKNKVYGRAKKSELSMIVELGHFALALALAFASVLISAQQPASTKAVSDAPVSLSQYRQWVAAAQPASPPQPKKGPVVPPPPVDFRPADEAFLQVLTLQARVAAARQSQDRLAGWHAAIKPRVDNQSIAALDVDILTLAEKRAGADAARLESDLRRVVDRANTLAARPSGTALLASVDTTEASGPDAEGLSAMEKDVLVRGRDLLVKMFQSFTVGGGEITELLWYESQATEAETNYRVWSARAGFDAAVKALGTGH